MAESDGRVHLWRPSIFALTWHVCTWLGWGLVLASVWQLDPAALSEMGPPFFMIAALVALTELRPIVMTRMVGNPVSMSLAFVFAAMYLWGPTPALVLQAAAVTIEELIDRRTWWKLLFNVGQYTLSIGAAWLVLVAAGYSAAPTDQAPGLTGRDLPWLVASWVVYHLVNLALVAGVASYAGQTWRESFTEEFWFYTVSAMAVLALSPLIALVAVANPSSWTLLPLLLLPLLAVQRAAHMSRQQEHAAMHDPLTSLPNRTLLQDRIAQAVARNQRTSGDVVVLFLDVDLFKVINDSLGHATGDAVLVALGERLSQVLRPGDTLARFGGDEFVMVCEDVPADGAETIAQRVGRALREPIAVGDRPVTVTVSIGLALAAEDDDPERLLRDADAAMYRAKTGGRNRAVVFDAGMHREATDRLLLETELRDALHGGGLLLYYQPILDLRTEATVGLEALLRWEHPDRGLLAPEEFLSVAEETGLIVPIGGWALRRAVTQAQKWRRTVPAASNLFVTVNIAALQVANPGLRQSVADVLAATGMDPLALRLEITESVAMDGISGSQETLNDLRALGVRLAIDDFGTGYSSLSRLTSLPVDTVKIDRRFVQQLDTDEESATAVIEAVVGLARALRLQTIAEGVETQHQRDVLRRLGPGLAQGFLWSPPIPEPDVAAWLTAHSDGRRPGSISPLASPSTG